MTHKSNDDDPATPGGHAAERLREFIDQRFPGGKPLPEGAQDEQDEQDEQDGEPATADADDRTEQAENRVTTDQQREESQ
jgi:hypothetical protein